MRSRIYKMNYDDIMYRNVKTTTNLHANSNYDHFLSYFKYDPWQNIKYVFVFLTHFSLGISHKVQIHQKTCENMAVENIFTYHMNSNQFNFQGYT